MRISAGQLKEIGTLLYGRQWQTPMAHLLDMGERSMRRYAHNGIKLDWKRHQKLVEQLYIQRKALLVCVEALNARADIGSDRGAGAPSRRRG